YGAMSNTMGRRKSTRKSSGGGEDRARILMNEALAWIATQKAGTNSNTHRAKMSNLRTDQLRELSEIVNNICDEIMWVNDREEQELMFDWGDKNIEEYIPKKQESYSRLMKDLEEKEMELHKIGATTKALLKNNHPASDKIEAYMETLQTQWSWLLQITKCIDTHLKENAAYSQFFKETNATMKALHEEHELIRKSFVCNKNTSLDDLKELLKGLEREKEKLMDHKRQVQHLTAKSKSIVRLKPRNPEEKGCSGILVKALTDYKQDQKAILTGNEAILKDNSQRSKWKVIGPGGLDMLIPSVCLIIPPPNPLCISLAAKNEQYYEAIMSIWHQLYINVKSLIAWQYCLMDIKYINSLTISMLSKMRPEEYRQILRKLEAHYEDFKVSSHESEMIADEDKRNMEDQVNGAHNHYNKLVVELPTHGECFRNFLNTNLNMKINGSNTNILPHIDDLQGFTLRVLNACDMTVFRLRALRDMLESIARAEDIVKVHEARLTEKETTSLSPAEVSEYMETLKVLLKRDILTSMESELSKANHWNSQMGGSFHRCDLMLSKFSEQVGMLSDRWRRIQAQIDTRLQDLQQYLPQLQHYKQTSTSIIEWIDATRRKQDALQGPASCNFYVISLFYWFIKALNMEIKAKRETVESVLKDNEACVNTIKDYETDLNSYTSGLETLLSIPIKRTMLKSPSMELNQEAIHLQTRYMELLTLSGDYYKFLGESLKNMEQLKIRNTRIDLLEEELRRLKDDMQERNDQNKSLEDAVAQFKLQLSRSQEQLLSLEEVKQTTALQCSATKDSLDSTQSQLTDLKNEVERLKYLLGEEKRKTKLAEERYTQQQEEYDSVLRKRQQELETVSWSKVEVEKSLTNKEHEIEKLRQQLAEESARFMEQQKEMSKVRSHFSTEINSLKLSYESQIQISRTDIQRLSAQRDEDTAQLQMQYDRMEAERRNLEDELRRLRTFFSQTEEQKKRAEEEAFNQRAMLIEDGHRRREMESQMELLMKQRDEEKNQHKEELAEVLNTLQEKNDQLVYVTHSLEEETRRRKTAEEGQVVLEQSLGQLQVKLNSSSMAATQLSECQEELLQTRSQLERENKERCRMEQNMSRLQGRIKDLQAVRDSLEGQVENLRKAHQEEVSRRTLVEGELEKTTVTMTEYTSTITTLLQSQEQASTSQKRSEEEHLQLKEELEKTIRENQICSDRNTQLSAELKNLKEQLLQEKSQAKEANLRNEVLYKTIGEKTKALNESSAELQRLKEVIETQTRERLRMEEELRAVRQEKEEVLKSKKGIDDELSSQITALELQLQASERSNAEHRNLVSELSSEREKLKLEAEKIEKQVTEIVSERDSLLQKLQRLELDKEQMQRQEEELNRLKLSLESEFRNKQRLQEENERVKRDLSYWKDQCDGKQSLIRQYDTDKDILEREKKSLKSEIEKLMKELRELEEKYKSRLTEQHISYQALKESCKIEPHTGLLLLPINEKLDPSKLIFDGVRKPVTAKQLFDCGVLDKPTYNKLIKGDKTVPEVSLEKKIFLKGTGSIAGVTVGSLGKMSLSQAKTQMLMPPESADVLLEAQAATGHIIDPMSNQKLTVDEACARRVVDRCDRDRLLAAEAAAVGYKDPHTGQPLSVFEAVKKGLIDKKTGVRLLQAQESAGGILDPNLSVFLPKDTAIKRNLLDQDLCRVLSQNPECYLDPDTERDASYGALKKKCKNEPHTGLAFLPLADRKDPSKLMFDGVRKPVSAQQLLDCGVLDKPTFNKLIRGEKTVPEVSVDKKIFLKGTGSIAGVTVGSLGKMSLSNAKKQMLMPSESADLLLEAQAATGHIIDPMANQKLTVEEACARRVVDKSDQDKLLAAEAAAVGYKDPHTGQSLSVFEGIKKGLIDKKTGVRLLQAQESAGGILDPNLSVFLPKDTALKRNLLDEDLYRALSQNPECYLDPDTERDASYGAIKKKCKTEPQTGLALLPLADRKDPSKLIFDGVRKPVSAQELLDCGVLDKPTFNKLIKGEKTVPEVSVDKKIFLKGTGSIAGVTVGSQGKMSLSNAKKQMLMPAASAYLLLEAQAATGHIIDPMSNQKLTVEEACARGVVDKSDQDKLLAAEAAAVGYKDPHTGQTLSVFEAVKQGLIDKKTGVRLLQAQESAGGILDPNLSVFLPKETALKRNLLDEDLYRVLNQNPNCYLDPDTECDASYGALKKKCKNEPHTGLALLPLADRKDPSKLMFDGVRKPVSAQQLLDCGVLDKPTFNKLIKGEKTVAEVSVDKKVFLKGTGSIAGVTGGSRGKISLSNAKKQMLMPPESADLLLEAQAATGKIIDPMSNQKLTVEEACAKGVVDRSDRDKLLAAEAAAIGYRDPNTGQSLSVFEAIKKGLIDKKTGVRLLQAQESAGGILDPNLSVFLPKETALKRNLLDEDVLRALNQNPNCYLDPDTERDISYGSLKKRCKIEPHTALVLLPFTERNDPSKLIFDGVRKPVSAQQLLECGVIDQATFNKLIKGEKTVSEVSVDKKVYLKGTGPIGGVLAGRQGKISFSEAKKQKIISEDSADLLLEAQAATGHIIDPKTEQKFTVEVACIKGVVDFKDQSRLLAAESAAVGYKDPSSGKIISLFEAMKKGIINEKTGLRLLQAQDSVGGILDPNLSVFLPKDTAIKRNLLDEKLINALKQNPACYLNPETEDNASYGALKAKCNTNTHTGLHIFPVSEKCDPSKILFDGVHKTVTAQQLLDCGVLDKETFDQLMKGKKTVSEVSVDIKIFLKGTGPIAGVAAGSVEKMSFTEAKKQKIMLSDSANKLLLAQAATGHIIDPRTNKKLTVKEAFARGLVDKEDESMLFAAEAAAIGYRDPDTGKVLSAAQAMRKGIIDKDTALSLLQAQESVGGILDPSLSVFLPKDIARKRGLIDEDLYQALNQSPECYLDPDTQQPTPYISLKKKCKSDPSTGLLLLPKPKQSLTIRGLRNEVSVKDLVNANLLTRSDVDQLNAGKLTSQDIENRLRSYLGGSTCIAGVYDEASDKVMSIYQAMDNNLLRRGTTLELLEAQAASGFMIDPINNLFLTVAEAYNRRLFGPEFKEKLLSAEKAVTGYKMPGTDKIISLFQAIENNLVEKGHGIRLLEAQIASGGIIDPQHSHRIDVNVAYKRGYFNEEMNKILTDESDDTKGFFDPNTEENLTYLELKKRCIIDKKTGLVLLPIIDKNKQESSQKNTVRKRRVIIVDPETGKEMTVREAYQKGYIDRDTYLELSEQECEWEEITITAPDGSIRLVIIDRSTGRQYDINDLLENQIIDQSILEQYRSHSITLTQFADIISNKTAHDSASLSSSKLIPEPSGKSSVTSSSMTSTSRTSTSLNSSSGTLSTSIISENSTPASFQSSSSSSSSSAGVSRPLSPTFTKTTTTKTTTIIERGFSSSTVAEDLSDSQRRLSSVSITLSPPLQAVGEVEPVGAIFDTEVLEKISVTEALNRGLVDSITAQRLLEAQACTGGIVNPTNGKRLSIQEASRVGLIANDMVTKLKPAQKAYFGFEDIKINRKLSAAQAMKEMWLPYEAGQRFLEFQVATGGLYDPEKGCRRSIEDALTMGWLDVRAAQKLQDIKLHTKILTCPKSKLRISYKEALDNCLVEDGTGVKMLQASSVSSRGISSPYNVASAPGSKTGSRSGSQRGSRRSSLDLGSSLIPHSFSSFTSFSSTK
uniref:Desmoplakin n=1 Tax=Fundulus heteroclitus TaxID=8078 RepID=A0A3Q2P2X6_FUNHE